MRTFTGESLQFTVVASAVTANTNRFALCAKKFSIYSSSTNEKLVLFADGNGRHTDGMFSELLFLLRQQRLAIDTVLPSETEKHVLVAHVYTLFGALVVHKHAGKRICEV